MNLLSRFLLVAAVSLLACLPTRAQQAEVEIGESLVCDTQDQAERFVALFNGNASSAAKTVNEEQRDPTACVILITAHLRGDEIATARSNAGFYFRIERVLVVAVVTDGGLQAAVPSVLYSVDKLQDRDA